MKRYHTLLASCLVILCACSDSKHAGGIIDETESTVAGTLVDAHNHAVPAARISLHPVPQSGLRPDTPTTQSDSTDSLGRFHFAKVPKGSYYVEANEHDSLGVVSTTVVKGGDTVSVNLQAQRVSKLSGQFDSTISDSIYCPQLGITLAISHGQISQPIILPVGSFEFWVEHNDSLLKSALPMGISQIAVSPATGITLTPTQINSSPLQDTIALQPGPGIAKDTYITFAFDTSGTISLGSAGNANAGLKQCYGCGPYDFNTDSRILIAFTMPDVIATADSIISATLVFSNNTWISKSNAKSYPLTVHKLLKDWKAGSGYAVCSGMPADVNSATINGATVRDRWWTADSSARWSSLGIGLHDDDASSATYATTYVPSSSILPVEFDITTLAREWAKDPAKNFGMLIRNPNEFSGTFVDYPMFYSGEYSDSTQRPKLTIIYRH